MYLLWIQDVGMSSAMMPAEANTAACSLVRSVGHYPRHFSEGTTNNSLYVVAGRVSVLAHLLLNEIPHNVLPGLVRSGLRDGQDSDAGDCSFRCPVQRCGDVSSSKLRKTTAKCAGAPTF